MLQIEPRSDNRTEPGPSVASWLVSLIFHALLALALWCLVFTVTKPQSIFLTGSTGSAEQVVSLDLEPEDPTPKTPAPSESTNRKDRHDTNQDIDALIAQALKMASLAETQTPNYDQPSAEFFGTRAVGNKFVFVLDISYSMEARNGQRFQRACDELMRSVTQLKAGQSYYVFLFCWNIDEMFYRRNIEYVSVHPGHEKRLRRWIYSVSLGPGTDPRRALSLARRMDPDAVFLLSDGQFNRPRSPMSETGWLDDQDNAIQTGVHEGVEIFYRDLPIHTFAFENPFTREAMRQIADATGGEFRYVNTGSLEPIDADRFQEMLQKIESKHRDDEAPSREYQTRISMARELIADGELLYAEYVLRPLEEADRADILNPTLYDELLSVLRDEVGDARLEDFQQPPSVRGPSPPEDRDAAILRQRR